MTTPLPPAGPSRTAPLEPLTLRPRAWRKWAVAAISLVFTAGGVLMIRDHEPSGWFVTGFFALCLLVALFLMGPEGNALVIEADGLTCVSPFRTFRILWSDVTEFGVYNVPPFGLTKFVGMNFRPGYASAGEEGGGRLPQGMRALNTAICGYEGALPETYGLSAVALARLLEERRRAATGAFPTPGPLV